MTVPRGKTANDIKIKKSKIAPDLGRYQPKYSASKPNLAWAMNYQKYHVADIQGPVPEFEKYDYTDIEGCPEHIRRKTGFEIRWPKQQPESKYPAFGAKIGHDSPDKSHYQKVAVQQKLQTNRKQRGPEARAQPCNICSSIAIFPENKTEGNDSFK